ncbi:XRE family transcriptional regulator [Amycolatopsis thermoflava]|uniref:XRE family transcriptional regulator n=1 Tax=Amycolatopsis thermoflava TaxID=84480 RepID=UPI003F4A7768
MYTYWESGRIKPTDWRDELCEVFELPPAALGLEGPATASGAALAVPGMPPEPREYGDDEYLQSVRGYIQNLVSLDNRFGGDDLVRLSYRFFNSLHDLLGAGAYDPKLERDFNAAAGELAEVVGWLAYDAEKHDLVRKMNHESLYFTRLAGDRSIELLTLQNASMHAGAMGRPGEALQLARSVLEGDKVLSPRLRALFLTRKARALAQAGDESAIPIFDEIKSLYLDGVNESDPAWSWWIDERELAWHEAMAKRDLRQSGLAIAEFEHSVEATAPSETRSQYLHRAYLLQAQVELGAWSDVEMTVKSLLPLVRQVSSTRTAVILRNAIVQAGARPKVPDSVATSIAQLGIALDAEGL